MYCAKEDFAMHFAFCKQEQTEYNRVQNVIRSQTLTEEPSVKEQSSLELIYYWSCFQKIHTQLVSADL